MNKDKKKVPPHKVITFDENNAEDMMLFRLLDKTRYNQSKFIKCLLRDFYADFKITEATPFEDVCYIIKSYIDRDAAYKNYQVLDKIVNKRSGIPMPGDPAASSDDGVPVMQADAFPSSELISEEDQNANLGALASAFDSLLG